MKSNIMQVGVTEEEIESITITCNGENLGQVPCHEYLRNVIQQNGNASNTFYQLNQTIFVKKEISPNKQIEVYNTITEPSLMHGGESWPAGAKVFRPIMLVEMMFYLKVRYSEKWKN